MFILLALIILILYKINIKRKEFQEDYLSKDKTLSIKGIFILIVFISHCSSYVSFNNPIDYPAIYLCKKLGQLMVTLFLFYSGYGIYESIKKKGNSYVNNMVKNRIAKILFEFAIAICSFLVCNTILGINFNLKTIILSFIGWESIGNSNWYIFAIIMMYISSYISFKIFKENHFEAIIATSILAYFYLFFVNMYKDTYWVDTILCFPLGMWFSYYKNKIDNYFFQNNKIYFFSLLIVLGFFIISYKTRSDLLSLNINAMLFSIVIIIITMKFQIHNKILNWLGKNLFWLYILQRIPMIILTQSQINKVPYIFLIYSLIATIILTIIYAKIVPLIENKIWKKA